MSVYIEKPVDPGLGKEDKVDKEFILLLPNGKTVSLKKAVPASEHIPSPEDKMIIGGEVAIVKEVKDSATAADKMVVLVE